MIAALVSPAQALTGKQLFRQCEALERDAVAKGGDVILPEGRDAAECWAYMAAVQDFAATVETEGSPSLIGGGGPPKTNPVVMRGALYNIAGGPHLGNVGPAARAHVGPS